MDKGTENKGTEILFNVWNSGPTPGSWKMSPLPVRSMEVCCHISSQRSLSACPWACHVHLQHGAVHTAVRQTVTCLFSWFGYFKLHPTTSQAPYVSRHSGAAEEAEEAALCSMAAGTEPQRGRPPAAWHELPCCSGTARPLPCRPPRHIDRAQTEKKMDITGFWSRICLNSCGNWGFSICWAVEEGSFYILICFCVSK